MPRITAARYRLVRYFTCLCGWMMPLLSAQAQSGLVWQKTADVHLNDVTYGAGRFVAVGPKGAVLVSPNGMAWSNVVSGVEADLQGVAHAGNQFVAVGNNGVIVTSADGLIWEPRASGVQKPLQEAAYGNGVMVGVGGEFIPGPDAPNQTILTSSDGRDWRIVRDARGPSLFAVTYGSGRFVAVDTQWGVWDSADGVNWTYIVLPTVCECTTDVLCDPKFLHGFFKDVIFSGGQFVAVGGCFSSFYTRVIATSTDAVQWQTRPVTQHWGLLESVAFGAGVYVAVGWPDDVHADVHGRDWIHTSRDGVSWEDEEIPGSEPLFGITYGSDAFVAVGFRGAFRGQLSPRFERVTKTSGPGLIYSLQSPGSVALEASSDLREWLQVTTLTTLLEGEVTGTLTNDQPFQFFRAKLIQGQD